MREEGGRERKSRGRERKKEREEAEVEGKGDHLESESGFIDQVSLHNNKETRNLTW